MKFINAREFDRKSGCSLRRTWGTRPGKRASFFALITVMTITPTVLLPNLISDRQAAASVSLINRYQCVSNLANLDRSDDQSSLAGLGAM